MRTAKVLISCTFPGSVPRYSNSLDQWWVLATCVSSIQFGKHLPRYIHLFVQALDRMLVTCQRVRYHLYLGKPAVSGGCWHNN